MEGDNRFGCLSVYGRMWWLEVLVRRGTRSRWYRVSSRRREWLYRIQDELCARLGAEISSVGEASKPRARYCDAQPQAS